MALLNKKYKGKSFAEIAEMISKKYQDRTDPISIRGFKDEMSRLRDAQEDARIADESRNLTRITNALQNGGRVNDPIDPLIPDFSRLTPMIDAANLPQPTSFATGDLGNTGIFTTPRVPGDSINPLRFAPILGNALNLVTAGRPDVETQRQITASPRQLRFDDIDFSNIKRDITDRARAFTQLNKAASGGNQGAFLARELANQRNVLGALSQAELQQQLSNNQIQAQRAQEQARIDQFNLGKQAQNINFANYIDDLNARNRAATENIRRQSRTAIFSDLGNIGREKQLSDIVTTATGYTPGGVYAGADPNYQNPLLNYLVGGFMQRKKGGYLNAR